jgi:hypothetical protein
VEALHFHIIRKMEASLFGFLVKEGGFPFVDPSSALQLVLILYVYAGAGR